MTDHHLRTLEREAQCDDEAARELARELARLGLRGPRDPLPGDVVGIWKRGTSSSAPPDHMRRVETVAEELVYRSIPAKGGRRCAGKRQRLEVCVRYRTFVRGAWVDAPGARPLRSWRVYLRRAGTARLLVARRIGPD